MAFVFAKRLQKVCATVISENQSGYLKWRYTGCNARILNDIIKYCEKANKYGAIICLHFKKAFDSWNWNLMFGTLRKFGFVKISVRQIENFYNNSLFCIKKWMYFTRGIDEKRCKTRMSNLGSLFYFIHWTFSLQNKIKSVV